MSQAFVRAVQRRTAVVAVGPSTVRNQAPGSMHAAREFLAVLRLREFNVESEAAFRATLDRQTSLLRSAFPPAGQSWGVARKCLNVFLRDAFYCSYLCQAFESTREDWFEVPLDSVVARELRARGEGTLPTWPGVKHLEPSVSEEYQVVGAMVSAKLGIQRVHLDTYLWVEGATRVEA